MWGINSLLQSGFSVQLNGYWLLPKYKYQCYTLGIFYLVILVITRHHRWIALLIAFSPQWTSIVSSDTMRISSQRGGFQVSAPQLFQVLCPKCVLLEQQGLTFMILEVTQARSNSQHGFGVFWTPQTNDTRGGFLYLELGLLSDSLWLWKGCFITSSCITSFKLYMSLYVYIYHTYVIWHVYVICAYV